ncbi:MAG: peptidoglycan DD-metalloendopeptidase family protein [Acidobacteriia bacterium]|nr:peptidoglycan DD-metalloendopeptidase family protein [Methyloceanibacter sp.]MCL6490847.1 peptidoglycan DD-metalloendopeptidase family protein [Terriglobia bacterium]
MQRGKAARALALCLGLLLAGLAQPKAAPPDTPAPATPENVENTRARLKALEQERAAALANEKAATARAQAAKALAEKLSAERAVAISRLQAAEQATVEAAEKLDALEHQRRTLEEEIARRGADFESLLPLAERLSLYPAETLLAVPVPAETALRGLLVLQGLGRTLAEEAKALVREQEELKQISENIKEELSQLQHAEQEQAKAAAALDAAIAQANANVKTELGAASQAAEQAAADAAKADDLKSVLARLERDARLAAAQARLERFRAKRARHSSQAAAAEQAEAASLAPTAGPGLAFSHNSAIVPVIGTKVRAFGAPTEAGPAEGVLYLAAPSARVLAPCTGTAVFAAPFRSYGLLLIIDCGGQYHFVLAGFAKLNVRVGQHLQAGDPVGEMPSWDPRTQGERPELYVELRHSGEAIDPTPWFRSKS